MDGHLLMTIDQKTTLRFDRVYLNANVKPVTILGCEKRLPDVQTTRHTSNTIYPRHAARDAMTTAHRGMNL